MKTALILTSLFIAFAIAGYSDGKVRQSIRDWCIEKSYLGSPATPADMYECAELGVALDNIITP